jgi:hypothetical protein
MSDDERPAFPPPRARGAALEPSQAPSAAAPAPPAEAKPARAPVVVHRPDPLVTRDDLPTNTKQGVKLTPDEVRALLEVSAPVYTPNPWLRRVLLLPTGGGLWLVRRFLPWPLTALLVLAWLAFLVLEVRRYVVSSRRW